MSGKRAEKGIRKKSEMVTGKGVSKGTRKGRSWEGGLKRN